MKSVFEKLQNLEIFPSDELPDSATPSPASIELTDRVGRRAEQLRQEWKARNGNENDAYPRPLRSESIFSTIVE